MERIDRRIAVSEWRARVGGGATSPGDFEIVPERRAHPARRRTRADREPTASSSSAATTSARGCPCCSRAWPEIHRRTGTGCASSGADPLSRRGCSSRAARIADAGIDVARLPQPGGSDRGAARREVAVAPSLGGESFGMVLTRAFACATPVVASDIAGYRDVMSEEIGDVVPAGTIPSALVEAVVRLLEPTSRAARRSAPPPGGSPQQRYGWDAIGARLADDLRRALRGREARRLLQNPFVRGSIVAPLLAAVVLLFWWRGPDWGLIGNAFSKVSWEWVAVAIAFNLLSVLARSLAWTQVIDAALPPPRPRLRSIFSAFSVGLIRERDPARARRRGGPRRRARAEDAEAQGPVGDARRHRLRTPRLRHRAGRPAHPLRHRSPRRCPPRRRPACSGSSRSASRCSRSRAASAKLHHRTRLEGLGRVPAASSRWSRQGLGVMRAPAARGRRDLLPDDRLDLPAARGVHGDAGVRHPLRRCPPPGSCCC